MFLSAVLDGPYRTSSSRRHVASYIQERDGGVAADWKSIVLCAGASEGIRAVMKLLRGSGAKRPGVMIPTPQYPLYSASLAEYDMEQVVIGSYSLIS